jgi:hypothetical protein
MYQQSLQDDDCAKGIIKKYIASNQYSLIDGKTTAKEVWDALIALIEHHSETLSGLNLFWTKMGIIHKHYSEGEDINDYCDFFKKENSKLPEGEAFDGPFLAQLMLMGLPHDTNWETITIVLIQAHSDPGKLTVEDVTVWLTAEWCHTTGTPESEEALAAHTSAPAKSVKKKRCKYCKAVGHLIGECQKKKAKDDEECKEKTSHKAKSSSCSGSSKPATPTVMTARDSDSSDDEAITSHFAGISHFPSQHEWSEGG